jgi:hypothetical protein
MDGPAALACCAPCTSSDTLLCTLPPAAPAAATAAALALLLDTARSPLAAACGQAPLLLALLPTDLQQRRKSKRVNLASQVAVGKLLQWWPSTIQAGSVGASRQLCKQHGNSAKGNLCALLACRSW